MRKWMAALVAGIVFGGALVGRYHRAVTPPGAPLAKQPAPSQELALARPDPQYEPMELDFAPVVNPPTFAAEEAALRDDEIVVGVVHGGVARAYQRHAFYHPTKHLVQDQIGELTIVVTHCSRDRCTRVFWARPGELPTVRMGGWRPDQTMDLIVGSERFSQQSPDIPLEELPFVEMTWGAWKQAHPETTVYRLQ